MGQLVIANLDRAGGHVVIVGVLVLVAAIAGLTYWLIRAVKNRKCLRNRKTRGQVPERSDVPRSSHEPHT